MTVRRTNIRPPVTHFEVRSVMLLATWTLGLAGTAFAQGPAPAPANGTGPQDAVTAAFVKADLDGDGQLSRTEATALPSVSANFERIDSNADGVITLAEFTKAVKL